MERGIVARKGWLWGILTLLLCLVLVSSAVAPAAADDAEGSYNDCRSHPIMQPDRETLERWIEAYNNAPRAYIEMEGFQVPSPRGSLSLLDHLEYTPSERNQGSCGNCWAWAGTGCLGVALDVQEGIKDRLSVQYINSCEGTVIGKTCCTGGWLSDLADFYDATDMAIPWSNTNAHWQDGDASCDTACGSISTDPNYPITAIQEQVVPTLPPDGVTDQATAIANIKNILDQNKAIWFGFYLPTSDAWDDFRNFWNNGAESDVYDMDQFCGIPYDDSPGEGGGHAVLCVGYNDNVPGNSYWIMLNSWGTAGGNRPNGLFRIDMDMDYQCVITPYYSFYWQTLDVALDIAGQPDITVSPTSFEVTLPPDTIQDYTLTISNDGDADLTYTISDRTTGGTGTYEPTRWSTTHVEHVAAPIELERSARGNSKLGSSLNQLLEAHREGLPETQAFAKTHMMVMEDDRVQVVIEVATREAMNDLREAVEALGGEYQCHYENLLQALVPIDALESLAERPDVQVVREPLRPTPTTSVSAGTVDTEGLGPSNASAWHTAGYTGSGVKVAVIDGGFTDYASLLGSDLPASVTTYDWTGSGMGGSEHGTACAEVVYDMAPGATMYLHKVDTKVELGNAVDQAIADGVDIISMSLAWRTDGPGDGTGYLADIVNNARSNGILYATAAGNNAEHSWSGQYVDHPSAPGSHQWSPGSSNVNYFGYGDGTPHLVPAGSSIILELHWDDWTAVDQDYNMELYYWDGDSWEYVTGSYNDQAGSYPTPEEYIGVSAPYTTYYGVAVWRYSSTRDVCLRLNAWHGMYSLDKRVPERSVMFPGDSPDAITVGAVDVSDYDLESYSSQGPTFGPGGTCSGGETKPDIAAYAQVSTVSYGPGGFAGTSAATPHVAGAAALVAEAYPSYTPAEIQSFLESSAVDLGAAGKDNLYGSGRLYLGSPNGNSPPYAPSDPSPADQATGVSVDADLSWTGGDPDLGDTVTYDVYFDTTGATTLVSDDQSETTHDPGTLTPDTKYYWKIVATDNHMASTTGPVWDFTTAGEDCPWLDVSSTSGSVAHGDSHDITVSIDTTGLGSDYSAEIVIANNDPDEDPKIVPVTLHVVEKPDLVISAKYEEWVDFETRSYNITYTVKNQGGLAAGASDTTITIDSIDVLEDPVPALAAGANYTNTVGPFTMSGNSDNITACADNDDVVAESNEANNCLENTWGTLISGVTTEVNCQPLDAVTIQLFDGEGVTPIGDPATSDGSGNYNLAAPVSEPGSYEVVASKTGFKDETQSISITELGQEYTLDFRGDHGLIPETTPDMGAMDYFLHCMNLYLEEWGECNIDMDKFLAVMNAYLELW